MIPPVPALAPNPDLAVVLQGAAFGALLGAIVVASRRASRGELDPALITARWTVLGALGGGVLVVAHRLGLL